MAEAVEAGMVSAEVRSSTMIYAAALDQRLLKCDSCGEMKPTGKYPKLAEICHERNHCSTCIDNFAQAVAVSKAINDVSDEVQAAMQKYIRTLASNVDLDNPHHERLLRRVVNFYARAKLVFARDTDEGRRKGSTAAFVGSNTPYGGNYGGVLTGATAVHVDSQANMEMWGDASDDPELDGIPRNQGINGQETMGSRMTREIMAIVPQFMKLLQDQVEGQRASVELRTRELDALRPVAGAGGATPREGEGQSIAVPVPSAPEQHELGGEG